MRNLRLAVRTLFKSPVVSIVAILSLALGIGANSAIFSLFNEMLLRQLPVAKPEQLVYLTAPGPTPGSHQDNEAGNGESIFSYPMYRDLERLQTTFSGLAAHRLFEVNVAYRNQTLNGRGVYISGSYFPTLGVKPHIGRLIGPGDDQSIGGAYVTVLGYDYWQSRLGADSTVLGQTILINGVPMTVIGVAAPDFEGTTLGAIRNIYVPISMRKALSPLFGGYQDRRRYW